ncbi:hypothetical protein COO91_09574 (plasmid) [Nostoc flagelliforme CCNUN1]|uniref:Uncharacterized protein n=1 Tax=Nostoc flagelliforme CCNUN1 TaxID=2038116 RepID=A0A2K8T6X8_9NOSO|nr:hypothetical protein [Nostoc flagelliforme]AUB43399.1 hypothetical protein COO91_09574 [Nostoc flagelliforme CCNUN1]
MKADICLEIVIDTLVTCVVIPDFRDDFRLVAPVVIIASVLLAKCYGLTFDLPVDC